MGEGGGGRGGRGFWMLMMEEGGLYIWFMGFRRGRVCIPFGDIGSPGLFGLCKSREGALPPRGFSMSIFIILC